MGKDKHHDEKHDEQLIVGPQKESFGTFLYNKKTGLVLGRSCKDWCQLTLFYLIFYACLFGFWIACLYGFLSTTNYAVPTLTGYQSMLKLNPAIGYRPQPNFEVNLVKFNSSSKDTYNVFVADVDKFLAPYFDDKVQNDLDVCDGAEIIAGPTRACRYNPKTVAPACFSDGNGTDGNTYGFAEAKPCIVLKMNRIYGWMPANDGTKYRDVRMRCFGQNEADVETLGEIEYYPGGSDAKGKYGLIPWYYFPFMNQPNKVYLSPLVFARFANIKPYTVALIWCEFDVQDMDFVNGTYWVSRALNERAGGAHFELVVDK